MTTRIMHRTREGESLCLRRSEAQPDRSRCPPNRWCHLIAAEVMVIQDAVPQGEEAKQHLPAKSGAGEKADELVLVIRILVGRAGDADLDAQALP